MISIHALRMESDCKLLNGNRYIVHFYPRSPHGERRSAAVYERSLLRHFYPRSPHGERHGTLSKTIQTIDFYPRSPHGERPI